MTICFEDIVGVIDIGVIAGETFMGDTEGELDKDLLQVLLVS